MPAPVMNSRLRLCRRMATTRSSDGLSQEGAVSAAGIPSNPSEEKVSAQGGEQGQHGEPKREPGPLGGRLGGDDRLGGHHGRGFGGGRLPLEAGVTKVTGCSARALLAGSNGSGAGAAGLGGRRRGKSLLSTTMRKERTSCSTSGGRSLSIGSPARRASRASGGS